MGVALTELLVKKPVAMQELKQKKLAVDTSLWLYQFLSSIRQADGSLLTDNKGNPTSHLIGLMSRISTMMKADVKLAFVFDGKPPQLKEELLKERKKIKEQARQKYEAAAEKEDTEQMRKYASMSSKLTKEMIEEAKELVAAFGLPVVQAPSEAEAQASHIVKQGDVYALATNDADALLFGSPLILRNLNLAGKRKKTNKLAYETITPDLVSLSENINHLGIDQEQLIALSMLIGTDYNPKGIKGIGPKNAIKLVKQYGKNFSTLFEEAKWSDHFSHSWEEVFDLFVNTKITHDYKLEWGYINEEALYKVLVDKHNFSQERLDQQLLPLQKKQKEKAQTGLGQFF